MGITHDMNLPVQSAGLCDLLRRDEDVADSTAVEAADRAERTAHPAVSGELRRQAGFAEGVAAYAAFLRTGEASEQLAQMLDVEPTPPAAVRRHAVYGVVADTREAICTCGVTLPESKIDQHVTEGNRS